MSIVQFRGLASKGIMHDPEPYQLPLDAWSAGANVRFHANHAERAPVFKTYVDALVFSPVAAAPYTPSTGNDTVMVVASDMSVQMVTPGIQNDVSVPYVLYPTVLNGGSGYLEVSPPVVTISAPAAAGGRTATAISRVNAAGVVTSIVITDPGAGYTSSDTIAVTIAAPSSGTTASASVSLDSTPAQAGSKAVVSTTLGDVLYLSRANCVPVYFGPNSRSFQALPGWDRTWSCRALRAYGSYLFAINVTKGAQTIPSMLKWSDLTLAGEPPLSWDSNDLTTSAGENPLEEAVSPLVDAVPMRSILVVYAEDQIWSVAQNGAQSIFNFSRLFGDGGMIAPNCGVEVDGVHYVFGPSDIYRHDGVTKASIIDGSNRDYVFNNLDLSRVETFRVVYLKRFRQVQFWYADKSGDAAFLTGSGCNRAAVYDIVSGTWSFIDLPNAVAAFEVNVTSSPLYATEPPSVSYNTVSGTIESLDGYPDGTAIFVSSAQPPTLSASRLLAYDFANKGLTVFPVCAEANPPAYLERTGIALDQQGSDLTTYKEVRRLYPQMSSVLPVDIQITVGSSLTPSGTVTWGTPISFDPTQDYKVDLRLGGRYLAFRLSVPSTADFSVDGFDADIVSSGRR